MGTGGSWSHSAPVFWALPLPAWSEAAHTCPAHPGLAPAGWPWQAGPCSQRAHSGPSMCTSTHTLGTEQSHTPTPAVVGVPGKPVFILGSHAPAMDAACRGEAKRNVPGTASGLSHTWPPFPRGGNVEAEEVTVFLSVCLQDRHSRGRTVHPGLSTLRLPRAVFGQQARAGGSWSLLRGVQGPAGPLPSALRPLAVFPMEAASWAAAKQGDADQPLHQPWWALV